MEQYAICGHDIRDVQAVILSIMTDIDALCREHKIEYFLYGGTLLGAVRHGGFIPWDDDLDIAMTRKNYNKFKRVVKKYLSKEYYAEDYFANINNPLSILKIKLNGTRYVEAIFSHLNIHQGVYVDVFPLDKVWKPVFKLQTALLIKLQSVRNYKLLPRGKKNGGWGKRILYGWMPLRLCRALTEGIMRFLNLFPLHTVNQLCHRGRHWPLFDIGDVTDLVDIPFECQTFPAPRKKEKILTMCYHDYMRMPPIEKRQPTHGIIECDLGDRYGK